ncbi:hypothetical protein GCM10027093_09310 [Paraburkholderia jirisanensis]
MLETPWSKIQPIRTSTRRVSVDTLSIASKLRALWVCEWPTAFWSVECGEAWVPLERSKDVKVDRVDLGRTLDQLLSFLNR